LLLKAPSFRDESAIRIFRERFVAMGVDASRIEFRGPVGLADMMAEYADVDIALDPVPYNGGTTTLQAMWMGVPVVVKEGQNFVSRMGASFMRAAGLPEWVAASDEDYVETAARMATDRQALLQLKISLRARLQAAPAWNIDEYTRDMERALRSMWTEFCEQARSQ
jgi:predicted O-linked N-acetylglucosamine transferase (SPINDLY family)